MARTRRTVGTWTGIGLAVIALAGCARLGIGGGSSSSSSSAPATMDAPMPPSLAVGDVFTFEDNGIQVQEQVTGFSGPRAIWQNDRGVSWVQAPDVISPPISWSGDPRLGQGNQQIFGDPSKLFPLERGKSVKFQVAGVSEKLPDGWQAENGCTILGQEPMTVKAGTFQTWRIACQRGEVLETIYYAPEIMTYALRTREREKQPPYEKKELIAFDLAQAPDRKLSPVAMQAEAQAQAAAAQAAAAAAAPAPAAAPAMAAAPAAAMAPAGNGDMASRIARLEAQVAQLERMASPPGAASTAPRQTAPRATAPAAPAAAPAAAAPAAQPAMAQPAMASAGGNGGRFGAHLGSYRTVNEAKHGWDTLAKANPDVLGPLSYQTAEFDPGDGRGVFIRLLAGPFDDRAKATKLCGDLSGKKVFCRVLSLGPA